MVPLYNATSGKDEDATHVKYGGPCEVILNLCRQKQHSIILTWLAPKKKRKKKKNEFFFFFLEYAPYYPSLS